MRASELAFGIEQLAHAFKATFHKSGEHWFPYSNQPYRNAMASVSDTFIEFLVNLGYDQETAVMLAERSYK